MIFSAIAAMSRNRVIGIDNKLPWHLPEDMKYFREKTKGRVLIMGRKTFESLPGPLPGRMHIVITRQNDYSVPAQFKIEQKDYKIVSSVNEAKEYALEISQEGHPQFRSSFGQEVFVLGGAEIYSQTLPLLKRIYLTEIDIEIAGDAFFPEFDLNHFKLISEDPREGAPSYNFKIYEC